MVEIDEVSPGAWDQVLAHSPLGMTVMSSGVFVRVNAALCELVGLTEAELTGLDARELAEEMLGSEEVADTAAAYLHGERRLHLEGPLRRRDGDIRWVAIDVVIVDDASGRAPARAEGETTADPGQDLPPDRVTGMATDRVTGVATIVELTDLHRARAELAASQRRFHRLLTNVGDTLWLADEQGRILSFTGAHSGLHGYPASHWSGLALVEVIHPEDLQLFRSRWAELLAHPGQEMATEVRVRNFDGAWEDVAVTAVNLTEDPDIAAMLLTTRIITPLHRPQRLAADQAEILEMIARGASLSNVAGACVGFVGASGNRGVASIYLLDGDRMELAAGGAPESIARYMREPHRGPERSPCDAAMAGGEPAILVDLGAAPIDAELRAIFEDEGLKAGWSQAILAATTGRPEGSLATVYVEAHEPTDHERQVADAACNLMAVAIERVDYETRLAHDALHDVLTGLANRALLLDRMEHALARRSRNGAPAAVLFCDIDRFKVVNDSLGHTVGDTLLVAFAERFSSVIDPGDTVARFGGDEFVVLLEAVSDHRRPDLVGERLAKALQDPFTLPSGQEVYLAVSIGVAYANDHVGGDDWLRDADAAMYRAKDRGRNRLTHFDSEMREAAVVRLQVENDLRRAVERDELVVHYQPVVDLRTGCITGAEALVRWQHPQRGLLAPLDFIGVAEDTGVIEELGRHVLDRSVSAMAALISPKDLNSFQLGVNVSARQLARPGLDAVVHATCERHAWPLSSLLLEITESTLFHDVDAPTDVLARIHRLGVLLSIDDFGTGYSSLTRLGRMPVNQVKIDQSFVGGLDRPGDVLAPIVDAVAAIAAALGLGTTAEGVETRAQLDHLRRLGVDQAQGFYFSPPLPLHRFAALLSTGPRW